MCGTPPKIRLRPVALDAHTFEDLARTHVKKLHVGFGMLLFVAADKIFEQILAMWNGQLLRTCDPWAVVGGYRDGCILDWTKEGAPVTDLDLMMHEAQNRLAKFGGKVRIDRCTGMEMLAQIEDNSLDFIYLDGDHAKEVVYQELSTAWNKVKPGGIVGSHDHYNRSDQFQNCGVADAFWDFCHEKGIKPHWTMCTSVWVLKS